MEITLKIDNNVDVNELGTITVRVMNVNGTHVAKVWLDDESGHTGQAASSPEFRKLVQHPDPERLIKRLHELIDGRKGADVGCILMKCVQKGWLTHKPTQTEFSSEFQLKGSWSAIYKYMDEENGNAWYRANQVVIF